MKITPERKRGIAAILKALYREHISRVDRTLKQPHEITVSEKVITFCITEEEFRHLVTKGALVPEPTNAEGHYRLGEKTRKYIFGY